MHSPDTTHGIGVRVVTLTESDTPHGNGSYGTGGIYAYTLTPLAPPLAVSRQSGLAVPWSVWECLGRGDEEEAELIPMTHAP